MGDDTWTQSSLNDVIQDLGGNDMYGGFSPGSGQDVILDAAGSSDSLNLTSFDLSQVSNWQFGTVNAGNIFALIITFTDGSRLDIIGYFNGTTSTHCASTTDYGVLENISFADDSSVPPSQVKALIGCTSIASAAANTRAASADSMQAESREAHSKDRSMSEIEVRPMLAESIDASPYAK